MELSEFLASLPEHLVRLVEVTSAFIIAFGEAWSSPLVALVAAGIALKFRAAIEGLLPRIASIKIGDNTVVLEQVKAVEETKEQFQETFQSTNRGPVLPTPTLDEQALSMVKTSPRYVVMQSMSRIHTVILRWAGHQAQKGRIILTLDQSLSPVQASRVLEDQNMLPNGFHNNLAKLDEFRTKFVYGPTGAELEGAALEIAQLALVMEGLIDWGIDNDTGQS